MRVAIVGAGISGLAAAHTVAAAGIAVDVYDQADRVGGKLRTTPLAGLDLEEGADAFLLRVPEALALARSVGAPIVHPARSPALVYAAGRLRALPAGTVLGVPGTVRGLASVLSPLGVARAALDRLLPATAWHGDDVAIGALVRRRLGRQVLDRMVDPLLGGVYAGSATGLSTRMVAPALADPGRSLLAAVARRTPAAPTGDAPVFGSVRGGTGALATAVMSAVERAGGVLHTGTVVTGLEPAGAGWSLITGRADRQRRSDYDAVVLAVPAGPAARLLQGQLPEHLLPTTPYASVAIVTLVYPPGTPVPAGNGFLVAADARHTVKAVTFVGNKWGHPADAPVVVRASVGRFGAEASLRRPDSELAGVAAADIAAMAGVPGRPLQWRVSRWGGALPQYRPGHLTRTAALRAAMPAGLAVCGAAYDGVGIPACVRSGELAGAGLRALAG
ncbi:MAG TPA: protoporphyrinogen oxidase [Mycobacteriales bacterium]|nr:protoporphyrinogen oxidase [Mycobacteriales bacterium]